MNPDIEKIVWLLGFISFMIASEFYWWIGTIGMSYALYMGSRFREMNYILYVKELKPTGRRVGEKENKK